MHKLSETQLKAMGKLHKVAFLSAYELQVGINTLDALVSRGLAERKLEKHGYMFSPRTATCYRLAPGVDELDYLQTNY